MNTNTPCILRRVVPLAVLLLAAAAFAPRDAQATGLALSAGAQKSFTARNRDYDFSEAWGLYVDIPLLRSFSLSPQTTIYRLVRKGERSVGATDLTMNFKFVIDVDPVKIDLSPRLGVTSLTVDGFTVAPQAGVGAGFRVHLFSNMSCGLHLTYGWIINDSSQTGNIQQATAQGSFIFDL